MSEGTALSATKRRLLEQMIAGAPAPGADAGRVARRVTGRGGRPAPLSAEQRHVWLHAAMAPNLPLYNEPITIYRRGSFDLAVLRRSLAELLRRHEIWRTCFITDQGEVRQVVQGEVAIDLPLIDLSDLPPEERESRAREIATHDARLPFDLAAAPLFRVKVMKFSATEHRLHITLHHLIFDGVSLCRVIVPELAAIYDAFAAGRAPDLAEPALHYADYTLWREARLASPEIARQLDHWRQTLGSELPVLQLPWDRPRPVLATYRGGMERFALATCLTDALKALARRRRTTLYIALLAAYTALLHRYSGAQDITVGGVTDMRRRPELEHLVGYFLNTIVLRIATDGDARFADHLAAAARTVLAALDASEVPFDRVLHALQPRRDPGCHPLFQSLFSIQPPAPAFAPGWDLAQMEVAVGTAKFDLYLELEERQDAIIGRFLYNSALFDAATIRRMIGHWTRLLEAVVAQPECRLKDLPLLTQEEERCLAVQWNATHRPYPERTLDRWWAEVAAERPDAVALRCEDEVWTYADLARRAGEIAASLRAAGVGPESLVGLAVERCPEMVAALLGILTAGGAYLPLDPGLPPARLAMILEDAAPGLLLTQSHLAAALPSCGARLLLCEDCRGAPALAAELGAPSPDRLAYVLYTSGSTGRPKGVEITHRALVNFLAAMQREPGFAPGESLLAVTTISFDIAGLELYLPLVSGGTVILAGRAAAGDPRLLADCIRRSGATMMQATPATWRGLIEAGWQGAAHLKLLCGGETLPRALADQLLSRGAALWNMFGPTETTIWSSLQRVERAASVVPIGRPIANTSFHILDRHGNRVPIGVAGDLYIGGAGLARGYRGRPGLTRERFVTLPIAPGETLYRTGDVARYRADGAVEWLARSDNQVKIRGFRIELEEIEAALLAHPAIAAAAVRTWPDAAGLPSLVAYVVTRREDGPELAAISEHLQQVLPDYMVPPRWIKLAALPLTANGKIDRTALPEPAAAPSSAAAFMAPEGEAEERLAALWREVLRLDRVGAQDDFFALGGHSLLAATLVRRIAEELGVALPLAAVFRSSTLRRLASLIAEAGAAPVPAAPSAVPPRPRQRCQGWWRALLGRSFTEARARGAAE